MCDECCNCTCRYFHVERMGKREFIINNGEAYRSPKYGLSDDLTSIHNWFYILLLSYCLKIQRSFILFIMTSVFSSTSVVPLYKY